MQKKITPVSNWNNGKNVNACYLDVSIRNDNLENSAIFYYSLLSEVDNIKLDVPLPESTGETIGSAIEETIKIPGFVLSDGNFTLEGSEYTQWDNSNEWAMNWVANKLNIKLI